MKTPIDRDTDPDTWMTAAYSNDIIITQIDDGATDGEGDYTSSASMPSIMLAMLTALDAHEGQRVLEIGTAAPVTTPRCWRTGAGSGCERRGRQ